MYCHVSILVNSSSVAREGEWLEPTHWPEKYAKYHVFSVFEADENSPPWNWPSEVVKELLWFGPWARKLEFLFFLPHLKLVRKTDWRPFFFGDHLISAKKTVPNLVKTFFLVITWFWQKNRLNLIEDWWKFWSSLFTVVSNFHKSPPPPLRIFRFAPGQSFNFF